MYVGLLIIQIAVCNELCPNFLVGICKYTSSYLDSNGNTASMLTYAWTEVSTCVYVQYISMGLFRGFPCSLPANESYHVKIA